MMSCRSLCAIATLLVALVAPVRGQPFISEFLASNSRILADVDGDFSDWIEIQNPASAATNLAGWYLTDNPANLTKWRVPAVSIPARGFLLVFASGKDRTNSAQQLHANFGLSAGGEFLALVQPNGSTIATQFSPQYPEQAADISYGSLLGTNYYFTTPTPGASNQIGFVARVADTKFSADRGFFTNAFSLVITSATPGVAIRYTTNGSAPTLTDGLTYSGAIAVNRTMTVRAAAFRSGYIASNADTHSYIFPGTVLTQSPDGTEPWSEWPAPRTSGGQVYDYGMDPEVVTNVAYRAQMTNALLALPSFSIVMDLDDLFDPATGIYANPRSDERPWERPASAELVFPDGRKGFQIDCGIRIRGGFSRSPDNPKHALRLFFREEYGASKLEFPLFGDRGSDKFDKIDLRTFQNYSWSFQNDTRMICVRDMFSRDVQLAMNRPATRGDFYHLYINGHYWGIYNTEERADASYGENYLGGSQEEYDAVKVDPDLGYVVEATDGTLDAWFRLWQAATNGLASNTAYFRVQGRNADGTGNAAHDNLLDVPSLIDYMLVILYGGNIDAPISAFLGNQSPNNWFGIRRTNGLSGGFQFFAHDAEHTMVNVNEDRTGPWAAGDPSLGSTFGKSNPQYLWQQLLANAEFRVLVADHVQRHFFDAGVLSTAGARARMSAYSNVLDLPIIAESARWGDAKTVTPHNQQTWRNAFRDVVNGFINVRTTNVLNQLRADGIFPTNVFAPVPSQAGGVVTNGYPLVLSAQAGTVHYTVDGTDPRLIGGGVSAAARIYSAALPITEGVRLRARALNAGNWSPATDVTFFIQQSFTQLLVSEIMYHPAGTNGLDGDEFEFIELKNVAGTALDLGGVRLTNAINFVFPPGSRVEPGQFIVLAANPPALTNRYPAVRVFGGYSGRLNNAGETLSLVHATGVEFASISYGTGAPWPAAADGTGFSLVPLNGNATTNSSVAVQWRASAAIGGSPGTDDPAVNIPGIQISEVLLHTDPPLLDSIELFNPAPTNVNVGGWFLTDDLSVPRKFRLPDATVIPAGGYLAFDENQFNNPPGATNRFRLDSHGDEVFLFSADAAGNLTGYSDGFTFPASENGVSFGRMANSIGAVLYTPQISRTFGAANSGPRIGPVVFNEIRYAPASGFEEFIELRNLTGTNVPLYDVAAPTNGWKVNGIGWEFPTGSSIPANGLLLVVGSDPVAFRSRYAVPVNVPVHGPFPGSLQSGGENLQLLRPDIPDLVTNGVVVTTFIPYLVADEVRYDASAPWPSEVAGTASSLERLNSFAFGNEPLNWRGSPGNPSPGLDNSVNRPPLITVPGDQSLGVDGFPVTLPITAMVVDEGTVSVQWSAVSGPAPVGFAPANNPQTQAAFTWPGTYSLRIVASDGTLASTSAVSVTITRQPLPVSLVPAGSAWKYRDTGVDLGTSWSAPLFDDSTWSSGPAPLGGGDSHIITPVTLGPSTNRHPTIYFRRQFTVVDKSIIASLRVRLLRDDGAVVYVNNSEALRSNLPGGPIGFAIRAVYSVAVPEETQFIERLVDPSLLINGVNSLAVEIHQVNATSSDLGFDLELTADSLPPLASKFHTASATAGPSAQFRVAFPAEANRSYTVQSSQTLLSGSWSKLLDFPATGEARSLELLDSIPANRTNRFYRIVTPVQP